MRGARASLRAYPLKPPTVTEAPARAPGHTPLRTPTVTEAPARASARGPLRRHRVGGARACPGDRPPCGHSAYTAGDPAGEPRGDEAPARGGRTRSPPGPPTGPGTKIGNIVRDPRTTAKSQTCARGKPGNVWS